MVKLVFQNSTDEPLIVSCKLTTEWPTQEPGLPGFERMEIKPKSCRTMEDVKLNKVGPSAGELYWTLFICFAPTVIDQVASENDCSNSLFLRFRAHKEITGTSRSYTIMTVPEFNLLPRPKWGTSKKTQFAWSRAGRLYSVILQRRGWRKIRLDLASADTSTSSLDRISKAILPFSGTLTSLESGFIREMFENERKVHFLGGAKYSKEALCFLDRSCWTDFSGSKALKPELQGLPGPFWDWSGEWRVQSIDGLTDEEGWMYAADWNKEWEAKKSFGKFVRRRLWVRSLKWSPKSVDASSRRESSSYGVLGIHHLPAKKRLSGVPKLASIIQDDHLPQLPDSILDDLDRDLFFVTLKESLFKTLAEAAPTLGTMYLDRLCQISQRYRRSSFLSNKATTQSSFVN